MSDIKEPRNLGGRPPAYETPEELESLIGAYFDKREELKEPPTVSGLAYHLGFTSRQSVYDYEAKTDGFAYVIKRARLLIEAYHEGRLSTATNPTGSIYWTKNHGWSDKQEVDMGVHDLTGGMTYEQKRRRIEELLARRTRQEGN